MHPRSYPTRLGTPTPAVPTPQPALHLRPVGLELLLGPDLQYIRINGAVVGGLAGLVLHAVAQTIG